MIADLRNRLDFFLRSRLRMGRAVDAARTEARDRPFQLEFDAFFRSFDWASALRERDPASHLRVADIGCRTFLFAPVLENNFRELGFETELHGVELDAYRRFTDFRTRADYGHFYATRVSRGRFHAIDAMDFREPLDVCFVLDPFVTEEPLMAWGLPRSRFRPQALFTHLASLLTEGSVMITSNPDEEEYEITKAIAEQAGLVCVEERLWEPGAGSDSSPRLGMRLEPARTAHQRP